ncbi:hypothetical protein D3C80_1026110 [compost metagenome]
MPLPPLLSASVKLAVKFCVIQFGVAEIAVVGAVTSPETGAIVLVQVATQPAATVAQSLRNSISNAPPLELIVPGEFVPVYVPIKGALFVAPS